MNIEVFHADSLAGPMKELKKAFEVENPGVSINLNSGRSKELAERILKGETCDVFTPSDPQVIKEMIGKKVGNLAAASWLITFSANEMVVITRKGNPLGIKKMTDLAAAGVKVARVAGEKDMATNRTLDFINKATAEEGAPQLGAEIVNRSELKAPTIPDAVQAVKSGEADAGIVYLSAAVAAGTSLDYIAFSATVNLSEAIRNVVTVPGTSRNQDAAIQFVKFILSPGGRQILQKAGQPPVIPPIIEGYLPAELI